MKYSILLFIVLISGCHKEDINSTFNIDCEKLADSFISKDYEYAESVIDSICLTLSPIPSVNDELGHEMNSKKLVEKLNEGCDNVVVEMYCYACLESFPLQSSFIVTLDSMNISIKRHFTLRVPEGDFMYMRK
ncbi:MAG: hypothetical protein IPN49_15030 [Saprospiraceae bacterium]|nr:hypothetical protein [Saprospiraceae bacterium]MBK8820332.1 hypothetical protein [Saprospiraceae bacterium]MBK8853232.1 hypothetical protein [Saprospiraceae bacterium]